jgi:hypothetical protein
MALPAEKAAELLQQQWGTRPAPLPLQWETLDLIPLALAAVTGKTGWRLVWKDGAPVAQQRPEQAARRAALRAWLGQHHEAQE